MNSSSMCAKTVRPIGGQFCTDEIILTSSVSPCHSKHKNMVMLLYAKKGSVHV